MQTTLLLEVLSVSITQNKSYSPRKKEHPTYPHITATSSLPTLLYEPLMPSGSYKKKTTAPKQTRNDPPAGLDDYIHDIGKFPVQLENVKKFKYVYDENESAFQGHQIADVEISMVKSTRLTFPRRSPLLLLLNL